MNGRNRVAIVPVLVRVLGLVIDRLKGDIDDYEHEPPLA
jgi:hypothetical protein